MNDVIDRYIHQVARTLPAGSRDDVTLELRTTIDDMVDARGGPDSPGAVHDALVELGDPDQLAGRYRGAPRHLIGPPYFDAYLAVMKVVLAIAPPVIFGLQVVASLLEGERGVLATVGGALWSTAVTAMAVFFWVTVAFALIERAGMPLSDATGHPSEPWSPDDLPELQPERAISLGEVVASVAVIALIPIGLVWQHRQSAFSDGEGDPIPLLDPELWSAWFPVLLGIVAVNLAIEVWKLRAGRWTLPLVLANLALNVAFVGYFVALFATEQVWNPAYVAALAEETDFVIEGSAAEPITIAVVVLISVWDVVDSLRKHVRGREASNLAATA
jgi:hypothetical protein